jgi:hypothetical protein
MPTLVDIPNVGEVEFPDGMNEADITAAIHKISLPAAQESDPSDLLASDGFNFFGRREPVPRAPQATSTVGQIASGIYNGAVAPALEFMASPTGMATAAVPALGPAVARGAAAIMTPLMAKTAIQHGAQAVQQIQNPNATLQEKIEPAAGAAADAAMALGVGLHASKPLKLPTNVTRRENTAQAASVGEGEQELQIPRNSTDGSIQDISRLPDVRGERDSGGAGLPSSESQGQEIYLESPGSTGIQEEVVGGNPEMRDSVRELPQETSRGEIEITQESAPRTINTVGEGQLFRDNEIPFNLAGETDGTAAVASEAEALKAQEAAKAEQDAAQVKMFEEPQQPAVDVKTEQPSPVVDQKDPLLSALDADMQTARDAKDTKRLNALAALKINYRLGKKPAIKKLQDTYGEDAQQPTLTMNKKSAAKPMTKMQLFMEGPVAKFVIENGGFMSPAEARKVKGREWWDATGKGMYEALGRIPPAYGRLIFKKGGNASTPDDLMSSVGIQDASGAISESPFGPQDTHHELLARLMDEIESAKGGKSARGVTAGLKSYDQYIDEQSAQSQEIADTKGLDLSVDDLSPGDTIRLPSDSGGGMAQVMQVDPEGNVTISIPHGGKTKMITLPSGHTIKAADYIRGAERDLGSSEPF